MQVDLVDRRAAGEVVARAGAAQASVAGQAAQAGRRPGAKRLSSSSSVLPLSSLLFVVQALAPSSGRAAPKRLSAPRNSSASARRSSGPDEAADRDPLALARELDQRAVAMRRLDPDPRRRELDLVGASAERALDASAGRARGACARGRRRGARRPAARRRRRAARCPANGMHQRRAAPPERAGDRQRPGAEREVEGDQLASASSSSCAAAAIAPSRRSAPATLPKRSGDAAGASPWKPGS